MLETEKLFVRTRFQSKYYVGMSSAYHMNVWSHVLFTPETDQNSSRVRVDSDAVSFFQSECFKNSW